MSVPSSELMQSQHHYLCKPCLKKLEKGKDVVDDLQQLVLRSRQYFGLPDVLIKTGATAEVDSDSEDADTDQSGGAETDGELKPIVTIILHFIYCYKVKIT